MNEKTAMNIDLRDVQEKMEDSARPAQDYGRKAVLATIGFWGLAYDKAQDMWKVGNEWVEKAEKRGEELEHEWTQEFNKLQKQPEVKKVVDYVEDQVDGVSKNAKSVVNEVEAGEDHIKQKYEEAIKGGKLTGSPAAFEAVTKAYSSVKADHDRMRDLKLALKAA